MIREVDEDDRQRRLKRLQGAGERLAAVAQLAQGPRRGRMVAALRPPGATAALEQVEDGAAVRRALVLDQDIDQHGLAETRDEEKQVGEALAQVGRQLGNARRHRARPGQQPGPDPVRAGASRDRRRLPARLLARGRVGRLDRWLARGSPRPRPTARATALRGLAGAACWNLDASPRSAQTCEITCHCEGEREALLARTQKTSRTALLCRQPERVGRAPTGERSSI